MIFLKKTMVIISCLFILNLFPQEKAYEINNISNNNNKYVKFSNEICIDYIANNKSQMLLLNNFDSIEYKGFDNSTEYLECEYLGIIGTQTYSAKYKPEFNYQEINAFSSEDVNLNKINNKTLSYVIFFESGASYSNNFEEKFQKNLKNTFGEGVFNLNFSLLEKIELNLPQLIYYNCPNQSKNVINYDIFNNIVFKKDELKIKNRINKMNVDLFFIVTKTEVKDIEVNGDCSKTTTMGSIMDSNQFPKNEYIRK